MKLVGNLLKISLFGLVVPRGESFESLRKTGPVDILLGLERLVRHELGELSNLSTFKLYLLSVKDWV